MIDFRTRLSRRIGMDDVHEITFLTQGNNRLKQQLYDLLYDPDELTAYQAAWVMTHFSPYENRWLHNKQSELIDEAIVCRHPGKRRLILTLLLRQPLREPARVDFLDFCMERMLSGKELPGVRVPCMKLAYELCRTSPDLLREYCILLDMLEPGLLQPAIQAARKNILKAMKAGKTIQEPSLF